MKAHFEMFAAYNRWANERLYEAAEAVSRADYLAPHGAFFGSLNGTLNHLVVTDRIWMHRFTGAGPLQTRLDEILTDDLTTLAGLREAEDQRIIDWVAALTESDLAAMFSYRTIASPAEMRQPLAPAMAHFFNHQTHHRGQAHCLLTIVGGRDAAPSLDLVLFQRQTGIGLS